MFWSIFNKINRDIYKIYVRCRYPRIKFRGSVKIFGRIYLSIAKGANISIGNNVIFRSNTKSNFVGIYKPVSIFVGSEAKLVIGNNSGFSGTSIVAYNKVVIGNYCNFGGNTAIWDTDFHPLDYQARRIHDVSKIKSLPVVIGDDVFVGANSIILKGVSIGDRSVIGAGSLISCDIPSDEIWAGNPAKCIRKL